LRTSPPVLGGVRGGNREQTNLEFLKLDISNYKIKINNKKIQRFYLPLPPPKTGGEIVQNKCKGQVLTNHFTQIYKL
jgi:hypothetical protein